MLTVNCIARYSIMITLYSAALIKHRADAVYRAKPSDPLPQAKVAQAILITVLPAAPYGRNSCLRPACPSAHQSGIADILDVLAQHLVLLIQRTATVSQ